MSDFDPDKYLAEKAAEFNPDAYLQEKLNTPTISAPEAFFTGFGQGGTLEYGDELGGQLQGLLDRLSGGKVSSVNAKLAAQGFTGDVGPTTSSDLARQATEENRRFIDEAQKQNPISYGAGNLAGAIAPSVLLAEAAPGIFGSGGISGLAKAGAASGAITGAGMSEGGALDTIKDAAGGAIAGGVVGGGLGVVGKAISALPRLGGKAVGAVKEVLEDTAPVRTFVDNYTPAAEMQLKTYGNKSTKLAKSIMADEVPQELAEVLEGFKSAVKKTYKMGIDDMGGIDVHTPNILTMVGDEANQLKANRFPQAQKDLKLLMDTIQAGFYDVGQDGALRARDFVPLKEIQQFKRALSDLVSTEQLSTFGQSTANAIRGQIDDIISSISPQMKEINGVYAGFADVLDNLKLGEITPGGYNELFKRSGDQIKVTPKFIDKVQEMLPDSQKDVGKTALKAGTRFNNAVKILRDISSKVDNAPELDKAINSISKKTQYYNTVMENTDKNTFTMMEQMRSAFAKAGNVAGFAKVAASNGFRSLSKATPQNLKDFANLVASKGSQSSVKLAKALVDLADKDNAGRNAMLFALEQNPVYRQEMSEIANSLTGNEKD